MYHGVEIWPGSSRLSVPRVGRAMNTVKKGTWQYISGDGVVGKPQDPSSWIFRSSLQFDRPACLPAFLELLSSPMFGRNDELLEEADQKCCYLKRSRILASCKTSGTMHVGPRCGNP